MTVGAQATTTTINNLITQLSVGMRNMMQSVTDLSTFVNGQGNGLTFLESLGFSSTDASTAQSAIAYLNTVAGVYYGTVQAGGTGGSAATTFNYNQELSQFWAGQ